MNTILAKFTVTLSAAYTEDVNVHYQTRDNTAIAGTHYIETHGDVTIPAGQTSAQIDIEIYSSVIESAPLTFFVDLEPVGNALLGDRTAECIIYVDKDNTLSIIELYIPTGPRGYRGYSAYEIAVQEGFAGTQQQWVQSIIDQYVFDDLLVYIDDDEIGVTIRTLNEVFVTETDDSVVLDFGF